MTLNNFFLEVLELRLFLKKIKQNYYFNELRRKKCFFFFIIDGKGLEENRK